MPISSYSPRTAVFRRFDRKTILISHSGPQGAFPARLKKVLIVGAPVWFRVPYNLLSLLLKEKLRERVTKTLFFI